MSGPNQVKGIMNKIPTMIQGSPRLIQLGVGALSGIFTGYLTTKVGKGAAMVAGGGILLSQLAYSQGFGGVDWTKIKEKAQQTHDKLNKTKLISNAKQFSHTNTYFAAGFAGGFLIAIAIS